MCVISYLYDDYNFDDLDEEQTLIIFDDMCIESTKKQQPIEELFIRGRKLCGGKGISIIYLTQQFYKVPKTIRGQMTNLIIRKIVGKQDMSIILRECSSNSSIKQMKNMYKYCCDPHDITQFLFIDFSADDELRFRKNFDEILNTDDFEF